MIRKSGLEVDTLFIHLSEGGTSKQEKTKIAGELQTVGKKGKAHDLQSRVEDEPSPGD